MNEMFVTVTTTKGTPGEPLEVATFAGDVMFPWLREIAGFEGLLMLSNEDSGTTLVLSFWENQQIAEAHRDARARFRDRITATVNVTVEDVSDYEVTFADLGTWPPGR
jgi:heme-degrading monooxygenase HmoA